MIFAHIPVEVEIIAPSKVLNVYDESAGTVAPRIIKEASSSLHT